MADSLIEVFYGAPGIALACRIVSRWCRRRRRRRRLRRCHRRAVLRIHGVLLFCRRTLSRRHADRIAHPCLAPDIARTACIAAGRCSIVGAVGILPFCYVSLVGSHADPVTIPGITPDIAALAPRLGSADHGKPKHRACGRDEPRRIPHFGLLLLIPQSSTLPADAIRPALGNCCTATDANAVRKTISAEAANCRRYPIRLM